MAKSYPHITTDYLHELYEKQLMSLPQIGEVVGMTPQSVYERFKKAGLKLRSIGESIRISYQTGRSKSQKGENNHNWKRGYWIDGKGYVQRIVNRKSYPEHRIVWENHHGKLSDGWVVHHLNGIKTDNRIENLQAMPRAEHSPKKILAPYKKRIRQLEEYIKSMQQKLEF